MKTATFLLCLATLLVPVPGLSQPAARVPPVVVSRTVHESPVPTTGNNDFRLLWAEEVVRIGPRVESRLYLELHDAFREPDLLARIEIREARGYQFCNPLTNPGAWRASRTPALMGVACAMGNNVSTAVAIFRTGPGHLTIHVIAESQEFVLDTLDIPPTETLSIPGTEAWHVEVD